MGGAVAGTLLAMWCGQALLWLLPPVNLPIEFGATVNWHMLAFTTLICMAAAVLTGVAPGLQSIRTPVTEGLNESSRGSTSSYGAGRTRALLVVAEVALAMVALAGTGVLARSFYTARAIDPGMDAHNVACAKYYVATFCRTAEARRQFCQRLTEHLRALPGVEGVSYSDVVPLEYGDGSEAEVAVDGYVPAVGEPMRVIDSSVSPGYFNLLRIPLLEGRDFSEQDDPGAAPVIIVNQAFSRRFLCWGRPVGGRCAREGSLSP